MRIIVVGLGVQGQKRRLHAGRDFVATVDPFNSEADYKNIEDVPLSSYDAAILSIPDEPKVKLIHYLLTNGKHVLVEKPFWASNDQQIIDLEKLAVQKGLVCLTAYNHRFEPHVVRMHDLIKNGSLGKIYYCRLFYGNGTARLVRHSAWRDSGSGVLHDLGSHLLDLAHFWFGIKCEKFSIVGSHCYENRAPDHVIFANQESTPKFEMETSLVSWRNHFSCDIYAENGSAHISSLCKWGPSQFIHRTRILPSGKPNVEEITLENSDPTWALEYANFKQLCMNGSSFGFKTDLSQDIWLHRVLKKLGKEAIERAVNVNQDVGIES